MLTYFPKPYPDEVLYSVLARLWRHLGQPDMRDFMTQLFKLPYATPVFDMPGNLEVLATQIPERAGLTADRIIDELTLFPYFAAFESASGRERLRERMRCAHVQKHNRHSGMLAFSTGRMVQLKYCDECRKEMLTQFGELYWKREHLLPGVVVCPTHGTSLRMYRAPMRERYFHPASAELCPADKSPLVPERLWHELPRLHRISLRSKALLAGDGAPIAQELSAHYVSRLAETLGSPGKLDRTRAADLITRSLGPFFEMLRSPLSGRAGSSHWVQVVLRKYRPAVHPLYYVLLDQFMADYPDRAVFGDGPWECPNPIHRNDEVPPIKHVSVHRNGKRICGIFACRCGRTYQRIFDVGRDHMEPPVLISVVKKPADPEGELPLAT
ncbi:MULTISPECIES: TnsD family Tn7-like transposition protein [Variovorax]|jgi:hypothetical protein|uniref:TnsD family Tn7-like transposition protein n=1 Tax=Variovorax TaxID=34072 RepID=UPI00086A42B0|nr:MULTISPECIES: TnsD family Tn7-like transposition protein [Variovorax]MBN8755171.1 TniQ family protein [Variovorax sp.]ODU16067.1 MAG: hypothetical protein ABS94_16285 [Variovorax sp. SCN 67-85]ODV22317.1 MAG: hypothetical protein ABT25_21465 [Variovorax sp. SCN 67-20]OJZ14265.1 MAG: hypothetical protein BGP22_06125 [Variovorax sp. 67-131]UKI08802.1 TnsD family transposase [Variovorax paradoxus]